ncbi:MAG: carboxypeptidase-like regulatory domain-containing protein, partial [Tepidisphaeraceae bacterium]
MRRHLSPAKYRLFPSRRMNACIDLLESRVLLSDTGTITGHVYGHTGNPLSNAMVLIKAQSQSDGNWQGYQTDNNGQYEITVPATSQPTYQIELANGQDSSDGTYYATLPAPDLYSAASAGTQGPDFNLAQEGSIAGNVAQWNTSTTLSGIQVTLYDSSNPDSANDQAWNWVGQAPTDSSGNYAIYGLDPRHYRVNVSSGQSVGATHYLDADLFDVVALRQATTANMNLQLRPAGVISGHVYNTSGSPVSYAHLIVQAEYVSGSNNDWREAWTDANGQYNLYLPATDQQVYPIEMLDTPIDGQPSGPGQYYATQIAPGLYSASLTGTQGPDFHLSMGGAIEGRIVTADGAPVAELNVIEPDTSIANGVFHNSTAQTDANGNFWVDSVPANTDIYLRTDDWGWRDFSVNGTTYAWGQQFIGPFRVSAGQTLDIGTLTVPRAGMIHGVVTDSSGNPVVGAEVDFEGAASSGGSVSLDKGDGVQTDSLGQYSCDYLPPGQYTVRVLKAGWIDYTSAAPINIASGDNKQNDVVLRQASEGVTISGAIANIAAAAPKNAAGTILPFSLIDNYDNYNRGRAPGVIVYPADAAWTISDMVSPDLRFTGQTDVTDGWDSYFQPSATPAGEFQLDLPTGKQTIQAMAQVPNSVGGWSIILSDPMDINAQVGQVINNLSLTVPVGTAQVNGQLSVPAGYSGSIGENETTLFLISTDGSAVFGRAVATPGHDGRYSIGNVPAGTYRLYAYGRGLGVWSSQPITLASNQTMTQNITMTYGGVATGTVTSGGNPASGVLVTSQATGLSATTNAQGVYTLRGLLVGGDTLTAAKAGLASQSTGITLASGQQLTVNFDLAASIASLTGMVRNGATLVGGATVVAYDTTTGQSTTTTTVAGGF